MRAIAPPSASISRTSWPFALPPIDGLQASVPMRSGSPVTSSVGAPRRAGGERGFEAGVAAADDDHGGIVGPRVDGHQPARFAGKPGSPLPASRSRGYGCDFLH